MAKISRRRFIGTVAAATAALAVAPAALAAELRVAGPCDVSPEVEVVKAALTDPLGEYGYVSYKASFASKVIESDITASLKQYGEYVRVSDLLVTSEVDPTMEQASLILMGLFDEPPCRLTRQGRAEMMKYVTDFV